MEAIIPCEFITFGALNTKFGTLDIGMSQSIPRFEQLMENFAEYEAKYELLRWDPKTNNGLPFQRSNYFTHREFLQTDVYSELFKPFGIDDHCSVNITGGDNEVAYFGIERSGGTAFSQNEMQLLAIAQSLLGSARRLAIAREDQPHAITKPAALVRAGLSSREADVLSLLADGKTNEEIAIILGIGVYTVKDHVKKIFFKTGCPNRLSATLWALRTTRADDSRALSPHLSRTTLQVFDQK